MFSSSLVALAVLASPALAAVFTTAPISSTSWAAGEEQTLTWQDDSNSPPAADFGPARVGVYAGNRNQQTLLQQISDSVDVSTTKSIVFTPDRSIGPDGSDYFIRFDSLALKDAASPQYPAQAFTAKFKLTNMTGKFNATVQAQVDGASTAPIGASTSASGSSGSASSTGASTSGSASTKAATTGSSSTKPTASASASAGNNNGARSTAVAGTTVALGALLSAAIAFM